MKEVRHKDHIFHLYDSTYMKLLEKAKIDNRKQMSGCLELEAGWGLTVSEHKYTSQDDGHALKLGYVDGFTTA